MMMKKTMMTNSAWGYCSVGKVYTWYMQGPGSITSSPKGNLLQWLHIIGTHPYQPLSLSPVENEINSSFKPFAFVCLSWVPKLPLQCQHLKTILLTPQWGPFEGKSTVLLSWQVSEVDSNVFCFRLFFLKDIIVNTELSHSSDYLNISDFPSPHFFLGVAWSTMLRQIQ